MRIRRLKKSTGPLQEKHRGKERYGQILVHNTNNCTEESKEFRPCTAVREKGGKNVVIEQINRVKGAKSYFRRRELQIGYKDH